MKVSSKGKASSYVNTVGSGNGHNDTLIDDRSTSSRTAVPDGSCVTVTITISSGVPARVGTPPHHIAIRSQAGDTQLHFSGG